MSDPASYRDWATQTFVHPYSTLSLHSVAFFQVWNTFLPGIPTANYNYDTANLLTSNSYGQWSCFTLIVNLKAACNPLSSTYTKGSSSASGCAYNTNGAASSDTADLSNSTNLFFAAEERVLRIMIAADNGGAL